MKRSNSAFTLIELLITISIISITLNLALPSFGEILDRSKVSANVQRLIQTLQSSRLKAISSNNKVTATRTISWPQFSRPAPRHRQFSRRANEPTYGRRPLPQHRGWR